MTTSARWAKTVLILSSGVSLLFGLVVLIGWHSRHWDLVRILPTLPLFPYTTYLNLFILSTSLFLVSFKPKISLVGGFLSFGFGILCFVQHVFNLNIGMDRFWFQTHLPNRILQLTQLGPNASVAFILSGVAIILMSWNAPPSIRRLRPTFLGVTGAAIFAMGTVALLSSLSWMSSLETWNRFTPVSLQAPPGFALLGIGVIAFAWGDDERRHGAFPSWFPIPVGVAVLIMTLILWEALAIHEDLLAKQAIEVQASSVKNEISSRIDFNHQALIRMKKHWESWKNPTNEQLQADVGVFVSYLSGCSSIRRVDSALSYRWGATINSGSPSASFENQISKTLSDIKTSLFLRKFSPEVNFTRFIRNPTDEDGFIFCFPIYKENKFDGFIYAVFRTKQLLDAILLNTSIAPGYLVSVYDGEKEIYFRPVKEALSTDFIDSWSQDDKLNSHALIWRVQVCPTPRELSKMNSAIPEFALSGGIILAILFTIVVHLAQTVYSRAQAVRIANTELQKEISERKKIETQLAEARDAALESARLKAEFVANMSHEIRTPMNGIIGMTGLLLETDLNQKQHEYSEMIRSSSEALLTIVNDILDFSKIEAGKLTFEELDFNLNSVVDGVVEIFTESVTSKQIDLTAYIAPDVPLGLRGDPGRLRQVLTNIVGNAVKFTDRGEVLVEVHKENEADSAVSLRFVISDSGIGISQKQRGRLFQSFSQLDNSTTRKYGGTGLGLAISRQLIKQMNGDIDVKSTPGKGSIFWFTVKLQKQSMPIDRPIVEELQDRKILIVEDNPKCLELFAKQSTSWGMKCTTAQSSSEAFKEIEQAGNNAFDVVLIDLQLGSENCLNLCKRILSHSGLLAPRLVVMSKALSREECGVLQKMGASACITKPIKPFQLRDYLITALGKSGVSLWDLEATQVAGIKDGNGNRPETVSSSSRVLVVEDNVVNQKVALRQLEKLGYSADAVANGIEALKNLEKIPYDIILMDCQMAEMDGYQTAMEIRKSETNGKHIPIIAMTAHVLDGDREKCIAAGMDDYLSKPVNTEALRAALEHWSSKNGQTQKKKKLNQQSLLVNMERLKEIGNNDPEEIKEMVQIFLQQTKEILNSLGKAIEGKNVNEITHLAHKGSGSSSSCGMVALSPLFLKLEQIADQQKWEENDHLYQQVLREFERTQKFLVKEFALEVTSSIMS
jgi:signal transduction histidine kinase/DNA-binding response OmpR family regulator